MNTTIRQFCSEAAMLIGAAVLLATAEHSWWYVFVVLAAGAAGFWSLLHRGRPLLSVNIARILGLAAFGFLIVEWFCRITTPTVMALSHFMILICITKWLQPRTLRDDAMLLILLLLLLVVGGIVGGNLLFPVVLAIYAIAGCQRFISHHLESEIARSNLRNAQALGARHSSETTLQAHRDAHNGASSLSIATATLALGAVVFVSMPRVGAGMFGQVPRPKATGALGGFARSIDFTSIDTITESDKPIMRLTVTDEHGVPVTGNTTLHLRGEVLEVYSRRSPTASGGWGWQRPEVTERHAITYGLASSEGMEPAATFLPEHIPVPGGPMLLQKYRLEATDSNSLFTCYPPLKIISSSLPAVRQWNETQVLQTFRPIHKPLEYTIKSPAVSAAAAKALAMERGTADVPAPIEPEISHEQRDQVLRLIDEQTREIGPLDQPANRLAFARKLEAFLRSDRFTYTLQPPPIPDTGDPVSSFLLVSGKGHCEYFAAALAVMCQLKGVPARVVVGYLADEYNSFGEFYMVRNKHAHAWVEVFVPGLDWVTFDPTPLSNRRSGRLAGMGLRISTYLDYLQFQWADGVLAFNSETRDRMLEQFAQWLRKPARDERTLIGGLAAFVRELFGWRLELSWHERMIYWVFTILVILLVLLLTYVVVSLGRRLTDLVKRFMKARQAKRAGRSREVEFYHRFCRFLADLGLTREPDQTPAEFAAELARHHLVLQEAPVLVRSYYDVAFGGHALSTEHHKVIEDFLRRLRNVTADQLAKAETR